MTHDDALAIQGWLLALAPYFTAMILAWLTLRNGAQIKQTKVAVQEGTAVSTSNKTALTAVLDKQDQNRDAITTEIKSVTHDLKNGAGDVIASKVEKKIQPKLDAITKTAVEASAVIEVAATAAAQKVVDKADEVATALVEAKGWDGKDRRVGEVDRRQGNETS